MAAEIVFTQPALDDLFSLYLYVAEAAGLDTADAYDARLRAACARLAGFPNRGTPRDDLGSGVRTIAFERRAVIVYRPEGESARILRVQHRGRALGLDFA